MTLLSLRPDLILVECSGAGIILVIVVQMPGGELFESTKIAGQVADYLMFQYRLGNPTPFVLLSSYREACLCCLQPDSVDPPEEEEPMNATQSSSSSSSDKFGAYLDIVQEAADSLRDGKGDLASLAQEQQEDQPNQFPSRTKRAFDEPTKIPLSLNDSNTSGSSKKRKSAVPTITTIRPRVFYSAPFALDNMMQGVSLAIICGLISIKGRRGKPSELWLEQGTSLDGLHPRVDRDGHTWAKVGGMTIDYMEPPLASQEKEQYLLVRETGYGKNGRVALAVDNYGTACALKFYLRDVDAERDSNGEARNKQREENLEETKEKVQEELGRWKKLQKKYFDVNHVGALVLNGENVLRMPLCAPVPKESRLLVLPAVKGMLIEFYDKGYGYKEVRWRHVGCRRNPETANEDSRHGLEIIVLDLDSLEPKDDTERSLIDSQIESLKQRAATAASAGPRSALLASAGTGP